jgi:hypothetical protein
MSFCPTHAQDIMKNPERSDMSFCYSILIKNYESKLKKLLAETLSTPRKEKPSKFQFFREKGNEQESLINSKTNCPFCQSQEIYEQIIIERLIDALMILLKAMKFYDLEYGK